MALMAWHELRYRRLRWLATEVESALVGYRGRRWGGEECATRMRDQHDDASQLEKRRGEERREDVRMCVCVFVCEKVRK